MRESQAWRVLAEAYDTGNTNRFLCSVLINPSYYDPSGEVAKIPEKTRSAMREDITDALGRGPWPGPAYDDWGGVYRTPEKEQELRDSRVLACLLFAEIARDEERAARGWVCGSVEDLFGPEV